MSRERLIPVAQYLRMSTDDQPNSIPTQIDAIQRYAATHGYEVVVTYADPGKSGLEIKNRPGLRRLLCDVVTGNCRFRAVLVYDVSRWGRFQDTDESAHYEFICRRAGIPIHYCAEQFENDDRFSNAMMKALKRTMAAEYSRELSVKIGAAHRRMAALGYCVGGQAGYGLRRMLISASGHKRLLQIGECKNLTSDHVVLVPGPKDELKCVRTIFELAAQKQYSARAIAHELNRRQLRYCNNQPWDYERVSRILRNEKFTGSFVWGIRDGRFKRPIRRTPRSEWVIKSGAFSPIIDVDQFAVARKQTILRGSKKMPEAFYLNQLARALPKDGDSPKTIARKARDRHNYSRHYGNILRAYKLIGHKPSSHVVNSRVAYSKIRHLKVDLFDQIKKLFPSRVRMVHSYGQKQYRILGLDNHWRIAVYVCPCREPSLSGGPRWNMTMRDHEKELPALICLTDRELGHLMEFYFVRDLGRVDVRCKCIRRDHPWLAAENRLSSLSTFCHIATRMIESHPQAHIPVDGSSIVGDVVFTQNDPVINIDGNEIQLSRMNAAIFKVLVTNAGRAVSRQMLSDFHTKRDREIKLNAQIGQIRKALGGIRDRIVTVRKEGYMYCITSKAAAILRY